MKGTRTDGSARRFSTQSDERLVVLARNGHERAFEAMADDRFLVLPHPEVLGYMRRNGLEDLPWGRSEATNLWIRDGYGQTETGMIACLIQASGSVTRWSSWRCRPGRRRCR